MPRADALSDGFFFDLARPHSPDPAHPRTFEVADIPTPYPIDDPRWDFSIPPNRRRGIFVGTREFGTPSRQHLAAILAARRLHHLTKRVRHGHQSGWSRRLEKRLRRWGFSADPEARLRMIPGPLPYAEYLRTMARHRIVFPARPQRRFPGRSRGDATALPVALRWRRRRGGNRSRFPDLAGPDKDAARLVQIATAVLDRHNVVREEVAGRTGAGDRSVVIPRGRAAARSVLRSNGGREAIVEPRQVFWRATRVRPSYGFATLIMTQSSWTLYVKPRCPWCVEAVEYLNETRLPVRNSLTCYAIRPPIST